LVIGLWDLVITLIFPPTLILAKRHKPYLLNTTKNGEVKGDRGEDY
jgi:hypothetical protein